MSKTKKIIIILLSIILILPCFCIISSADTYGTSYGSIAEFFELDHVSLARANGVGNGFDDTGWDVVTLNENATVSNWNSIKISVSGDVTYGMNNIWRIDCTLKVLDSIVQKGFSEGQFKITIGDSDASKYIFYAPTEANSSWLPKYQLLKLDSNDTYVGELNYSSVQSVKAYIPREVSPDIFNRVKVVFYIVNRKTIYSGDFLTFNFNNLKVNMYDENEKLSYTITQNQNENTDKIIDNQNSNAQSIIDNQNQLQENEKNEANITGDSGVDEIGSIIPNESQGFINSLNNLVGVMSYNGTNCNWELPSVSLPKIDGVMPRIKLWDKLEIPFEYWINQIPTNIMTLVQSLLTIALIVYCFKELYSIISYVLTLKGGGTGE